MQRQRTPYLLLALLLFGSGLGVGLGLSESTSSVSARARLHLSVEAPPLLTSPSSAAPVATSSPPSPPELSQIAFFNSTSGYGLFFTTGSGMCSSLVESTEDAGATFDPMTTVNSWACSSDPPANELAFDDHGDGFVYNPELFVTHDGGRSWVADPPSGTVLSVQALGYSIWMLEGICPTGSQPTDDCPLQLLESSNGGVTWTPSPAPPPTTVNGSSNGVAEEGALGQSWLVRTTKSTAYIVSNPVANNNGADDAASLLSTEDGGASWTTEQIPCGLDASSVVLASAPDGSLLAVCAGQPSAGYQPKAVSRSFDGGRTWSVYPGCAAYWQKCPNPSPAIDNGYLGEVDAVSASTAYLTGNRSLLLVTHDGGISWEPTGVGDEDGGPSQTIFFSPEDGVVLGDGTLWTTTDGGVDWWTESSSSS